MSGLTFHVRLEERATMDVCCLSLNFHARYGPNPFDCLKRRALGLRLRCSSQMSGTVDDANSHDAAEETEDVEELRCRVTF